MATRRGFRGTDFYIGGSRSKTNIGFNLDRTVDSHWRTYRRRAGGVAGFFGAEEEVDVRGNLFLRGSTAGSVESNLIRNTMARESGRGWSTAATTAPLVRSYMNQIGADVVTINEIIGDSGIGFTGYFDDSETEGTQGIFDLGIDEIKDVTSLSFNFGGGNFNFEGTATELASLKSYTNFMDLEGFLGRQDLYELPAGTDLKVAKEQSRADAARTQNYIRGRIAAERSTLKAIHMSNQLQGTYI